MIPSGNDIPAPAAAPDAPRYLQIAHELRTGIVDGTYPVGARLPTEAELCERFAISRFTAREAVRVLASAGLVVRRQRAGTVVIALPGEARYEHSFASLGDLQQYARDTEMKMLRVGRVALDRARARAFGDKPGTEWTFAIGVRREAGGARGGRPICVTRVYLSPELAGIEARLDTHRAAIYAMIENDYGRPIVRVEQDLVGTVLDAEDAAHLEAAAGAPALLIVRRYFDAGDRLLEVSENIHPADRFTYRMELRK
jgi:DNA-binding GntR family transcriptional regulator